MRFKQKQNNTAGSAANDADTFMKIINAAQKLFLEKGYQATTTRDIAAEAGVTLGLIPYYFKTKENLAKKVCYDLMGDFYVTKLKQFDLDTLSNAEKLYILDLLIFEHQFTDSAYGKLFFELGVVTDISSEPSDLFKTLTDLIIKDYSLEMDDGDKAICYNVLFGASKRLLEKHSSKEISLDFVQFVDILIADFFFNLGIPENEINNIISRGHSFYYQHKADRIIQLKMNE